ncbi:MAG: Crp/Fnr family transcriptional regulator [Thermoflexales bacterium]|nr:Crp/Fnr family transcriptional regulator [Thermoflexales bacterium]
MPSADWTERVALLRRLPYFAVLDEPILQAIAGEMRCRTCSAGEIVIVEGEPCAGLFIVQTGRLQIVRSSLQGREQILHFASPGESFNDVPVFDGGPNPATVQALEDSRLFVIEHPLMLALLDRYPQLARAVVGVLATRCRQLVALVQDLSLHTVTVRLAGLLLDQAEHPDPPTLTRAQMAARLGTVREMISRSLRELEQEGLIRLDGPRIVIIDRVGLACRAQRPT